MAFGSLNTLGSNSSKTAGTSLAITTSAAAEVGNIVVVLFAGDNLNSVDGETSPVTSVTDSAGGNNWQLAKQFENSQGAAAAGIAVAIYWTKVVNQIASGGTITVNFSSITAKAITAWEFSVGSTNSMYVAGSNTLATDGADPGSITISSLVSKEYLWIHALAIEGPNGDAYTWDADYTEFSGNGTTGGAVNNASIRGGFRIFTGTTDTVDVTSDTADRDYAQAYVAFAEAPPTVAHDTYQGGWQPLTHNFPNIVSV